MEGLSSSSTVTVPQPVHGRETFSAVPTQGSKAYLSPAVQGTLSI